MKLDAKKLADTVVVVLLAAPVLGFLMGGVYSMPAIRLTGGREPWLSILLGGGAWGISDNVESLSASRRVSFLKK